MRIASGACDRVGTSGTLVGTEIYGREWLDSDSEKSNV